MAVWPSFQKVPQLDEAVISAADVSSTNHVHPGSSHPRQVASGVPPAPQPPSCLRALPSLCLSPGRRLLICLSTPLRPPSDQPLVQAGLEPPLPLGPPCWGWSGPAPLKSGSGHWPLAVSRAELRGSREGPSAWMQFSGRSLHMTEGPDAPDHLPGQHRPLADLIFHFH